MDFPQADVPLVWSPSGAANNLSSGICSTSLPSSCFQLSVQVTVAQYFLPRLKSSFPEVPPFGSQTGPCGVLAAARAPLASPHRGCQHLDNYTECNDLEKWLLKMTEKGVGCITCLQLSVKKKKPLIPNNPHSGSTTDSTLADFPLHAHLTELLNPQLLPSLLNQILD